MQEHMIGDLRLGPTARPRFLRVRFYPNKADLQEAVSVYSKRHGLAAAETNTFSAFHPTAFRGSGGEDSTTPYAGMIRLARTHLTPMFIAEQAARAALHLTRLRDWEEGCNGTAKFGTVPDETEQEFCRLTGTITHHLIALSTIPEKP